jgi:deoxyadenosine/deoxycytidine kinase
MYYSSFAEKKPLLIVEGNIGAGKSTFLKLIGKRLNAQLVYEPIDKWQNVSGENILEHFYKDTQRWAYTFQTFAFITRVIAQQEQAKTNICPMQVLERSVYSDRYCFAKNCFELGLMTALEWKLYQEWFSWLVENYAPRPDAFIYLKTDPEVCYERLLKRNRSEEAGVGLDYLRLVHNKHEEWLIHKKDVSDAIARAPVLSLECNEDFESNNEAQEMHLSRILDFLDTHFQISRQTATIGKEMRPNAL